MEITATPPQGKICDGTGSQFSCFGVIYLCTKFHAFTTKCTIPSIIDSYPLDYRIGWVSISGKETHRVCMTTKYPHQPRGMD